MTRQLWNEASLSERLGNEGYAWFVDRATKRISVCTVCGGKGEVEAEPYKGGGGAVYARKQHCHYCSLYVNRMEEFTYSYFNSVPAAYRKHTLSQLKPYEGTKAAVSLERQEAILDMLKAEPESGYVFFGPPHAGKTAWTTALYISNLYRYYMGNGSIEPTDREKTRGKSAVWRTSAKKLLDQHTEYSMKQFDKDEDGSYITMEPEVTASKIHKYRKLGVRSKLFLEEIDKINMTDARSNNLFEIIDALHEEEGIIVINSNLRPEEFTVRFGEQFTWRLGERSKVINLFEK